MSLESLMGKLEEGFYVDNLREMARICKNLALDAGSPTPFFVMEQVFQGIGRRWDDRPLSVEEAKSVESKMLQPIKNLAEGIEAGVPGAEILDILDEVVANYAVCFM